MRNFKVPAHVGEADFRSGLIVAEQSDFLEEWKEAEKKYCITASENGAERHMQKLGLLCGGMGMVGFGVTAALLRNAEHVPLAEKILLAAAWFGAGIVGISCFLLDVFELKHSDEIE